MFDVPPSLKRWFLLHGIVDVIFGALLLVAPRLVLAWFGLAAAELVTARLLAAALIGIGIISLVARSRGRESYATLLDFKILWAAAAILALVISIAVGAPPALWFVAAVFAVFLAAWICYRRVL